LNYGPNKARRPKLDQSPAAAPQKVDFTPQHRSPEPPPWRRSKRSDAFPGDVAIAELRNRLALAPDRLAEPPPVSTGSKFSLAGRLAGLVVVGAAGVVGYRLGLAPPASPNAPPVAFASAPPFTEQKPRDPSSPQASFRQLAVNAVQTRQADEPARLTLSAGDGDANEAVVIDGLAPGSALSVGTQAGPGTWRLSTQGLDETAIMPPGGFVGAMDLTLELRLADNTVADRKSLRLEWSPKSALAPAESQLQRLAASEIELMVKRGAEYMAIGNVGAARMILLPAAEADDSVAAFALAETYDPLVLRKLNAKGGIAADISIAQTWYEKAKDLGYTVASERLARLARLAD
jgi:hypothetical protein